MSIPLTENRFLQAGKGAENTKEKIQPVLYRTGTHGFSVLSGRACQSRSLKPAFFRQVMELKIQRKNPANALQNRNPFFKNSKNRTTASRPSKTGTGPFSVTAYGPGFTNPVP
jgi:hypothetical protein